MRLFKLKSKAKGHIELLYDNNGLLRKIDFNGVEMSQEAIKWVKGKAAPCVEDVFRAFEGSGATIEEGEFTVTFADFRREYPYTRNAHLAEKYWPTMTSANQYRAFVEAQEYRKYCDRNTWYKPKMADKWLKEEQYKNNWKEL
jgi:hypothetical protein